MGINTWEGVEWLDGDRFADLLAWAVRLDAIETGEPPDTVLAGRLTAAAGAAGYDLARLRASLGPATTTGRTRRSRKKERP